MRFGSLQRFGFNKVPVWFPGLPRPGQVPLSRFGHRLNGFPQIKTLGSFFIPQRSWDYPLRDFPS